jgi:hypothetical protein
MLNNTRRIAFVGGLDRLAPELVAEGEACGVEVELHTGNVHGRRAEGLASVVSRADLVVLVTDLNSHGGVFHAKREARRAGVRLKIVRKASLSAARALIRELAAA